MIKNLKTTLAIGSAILALASLGVSVAALLISKQADDEQRSVDLEAAASVGNLGSTPAGYAIRITLVNGSLRPVIVNSMELEVDGESVAPIGAVLPGNHIDARNLGDEPLFRSRPLPFALAERGATTLTGFADFSGEADVASRASRARLRRLDKHFCSELPNKSGQKSSGRGGFVPSDVELNIDYKPGGSMTIPVRISSLRRVENSWRMEVLANGGQPDGIAFWRYAAAPSALHLVTLDVWKGDGGLMRSVNLPVAGAATTEAKFKPLPDGYYRAALIDEGHPVAVGHFDVPLSGNLPIYPQLQQLANGTCELLRTSKNVFVYPRRKFESPHGWEAQLRVAHAGS